MLTINYGTDYTKTTYDTLTASDIKQYLQKNFTVSLKPNLVVERPASGGATTHPEVIEGIIKFLKDFGIKKINVIENSACGHSTKLAYRTCGYEELNKKYGVQLVDLKDDKFVSLKYDGIDFQISETALKSGFLINVPVLKAHCQTRLTCCMKNLKGCMPQSEMRRFHSLGLHKPIAGLNALFKTHLQEKQFCVVDGICGDLSYEEGGTPVEANRIIACHNPLLVDSYCAELIGFNIDDIGYLTYGKEYGIGEYFSDKTEINELNIDQKPKTKLKSERIAEKYKNLIDEREACSVCYAALIFALHRKGGLMKGKKICIGQGFKGKSSNECFGIGNCTQGFKNYVKGCPPKAVDILEML